MHFTHLDYQAEPKMGMVLSYLLYL